jgi:hypothetical protein
MRPKNSPTEHAKQVVDLLCMPVIRPFKSRISSAFITSKKRLAVPAQYKFACKYYAIADNEEKSN